MLWQDSADLLITARPINKLIYRWQTARRICAICHLVANPPPLKRPLPHTCYTAECGCCMSNGGSKRRAYHQNWGISWSTENSPPSHVLHRLMWSFYTSNDGSKRKGYHRNWGISWPPENAPPHTFYTTAPGDRDGPDPLQTHSSPHGLRCRIWSLLVKRHECVYGDPPTTQGSSLPAFQSHFSSLELTRSIMYPWFLINVQQ